MVRAALSKRGERVCTVESLMRFHHLSRTRTVESLREAQSQDIYEV